MLLPPVSTVVAYQALTAGLQAALGRKIRVSSRKPDPEGLTEFVVISRIGGGEETIATQAPRFLVECYHLNEADAERIALAVTPAMRAQVGRTVAGGVITRWSPDGNLVRFNDPNPSHFRFQLTGVLGIGTAAPAG